MIFIIDLNFTPVELCRKLLSLYGNGERNKRGGGEQRAKSCLNFNIVCIFSIFAIHSDMALSSEQIFFESIIIINFYRFFKYIWNCLWIRKAKPKAATLTLFLLISSDMLDLFIPPRKKKTINFGQLYTREFTFVLQHSWKRLSCHCGMQKTIYQAFNKLQNIYVVQPIWNEMQR